MADQLDKLLAMLSSDFEGERANAAGMIAKMAKAENKTIPELVRSGGGRVEYVERIVYRDQIVYRDRVKVVYRDRYVEKSSHPADIKPRKPGMLNGLRWAAQYPEHLTAWEFEFASNVPGKVDYDDDLTTWQEQSARSIIRKVLRKESDPII